MGKKNHVVHFKIFNRKLLSEFATYRSMEKGEYLYESGAVTKPEITGNGVEAIVHGSRRYKCSILWDAAENDWDFYCTCPYDHGGICKHSFALGLWLIDNCEYALREIPVDNSSDIDKLLNQADPALLREFVKEIISADKVLMAKFAALIYNLETALDEVSIDYLAKKYLELFTLLEVTDEEEINEKINWRSYDYYMEDWEMIEKFQSEEVEEQLEGAFDEISGLIESGKLLQAIYHYFAFMEAFADYEVSDYIDKDYVLSEIIDDFIEKQQSNIKKLLKKQAFRTETLDIIINTFTSRYLAGKSADHFLLLFEDFLLCLPYNKDQAAELLKTIRNVSVTAADELQLKLVNITQNRTMKAKICQDIVAINLEAARFILNKYKNSPQEYHQTVKKLMIKFSQKLLPEVFPNLQKDIDPDLYREVADSLFQMTGEIKYYRIYKESSPDFQFEHYLEKFDNYDDRDKSFDILLEEKQYEQAFQFYMYQLRSSYETDQYLLKLINHLPQSCYDHIIKTTSATLASPGKREKYLKAGKLLAVLLKFDDTDLRKKGRKFIDDLCQKYKKRPAMLDEFRSLHII